MRVTVKTPNRIDFAGGTLDLYPLYLFLDGGVTVNAGVTIYSHVTIETREDSQIHIVSKDLKYNVGYGSIGELDLRGSSSFIQRAVKSYHPSFGINVTTYNEAPKGSGLGASSSLLMALSAALLKVSHEKIDYHRMIDQGAAIEAGHLGIPTGKQDYYGAVLGKVHALHFDERGCQPGQLPVEGEFRSLLDRSLIVSFTGISHYSGANNWDMLKMAIDREGSTYENLKRIKDIASRLADAFIAKDLEKIAECVHLEWQQRKQMAPGITNDYIDEIIEKAKNAGALASKLCGAGGGGCMITLVPPDKRERVIREIQDAGACVMDAGIDYDGIQIEVS